MRSAYNHTWLYNLSVIKETKRWAKQDFISKEQLALIHDEYKSEFYHPNFLIRILLFVATLLALSGVTGLLGLMVAELAEEVIFVACIMYGAASFFFAEQLFIQANKHYKSGVTEALIYHSSAFIIIGVGGVTDFDTHVVLMVCTVVLAFTAIRYLDLLSTIASVLSAAGLIFFEFYNLGGIFQNIIPFIFIIAFTFLYFFIKKLKQRKSLAVWGNNLLIGEALSLLFIYAAGNYLVVRELSISMMDLNLDAGQDIPFAWMFYGLTILIPVMYLYFGIKNKDMMLLRVSLLVIAFSVFTFKYYFSLGHPEITLTIAGAIVIGIALMLLNYLKTIRNGFTRENLLAEKWGNMNVQAILISQTLGGNDITVKEEFSGGGGEFGGGGASGSY